MMVLGKISSGMVTAAVIAAGLGQPAWAQPQSPESDAPPTEECGQVIGVLNSTVEVMEDFKAEIRQFTQEAAAVNDLADLRRAATRYVNAVDAVVLDLDAVDSKLLGLTLEDLGLIDLRDNHARIIRGVAQAMNDAGAAMDPLTMVTSETELPAMIEQSQMDTVVAIRSIETYSAQEAESVEEINAYCGVETQTLEPRE